MENRLKVEEIGVVDNYDFIRTYNRYYKSMNKVGYNNEFNRMIDYLIKVKEETNNFSPIWDLSTNIKQDLNIKRTPGVTIIEEFLIMMVRMLVIDRDINYKLSVNDNIHLIKSLNQINYIIDNNMTLDRYSRYEKILKIKEKSYDR